MMFNVRSLNEKDKHFGTNCSWRIIPDGLMHAVYGRMIQDAHQSIVLDEISQLNLLIDHTIEIYKYCNWLL